MMNVKVILIRTKSHKQQTTKQQTTHRFRATASHKQQTTHRFRATASHKQQTTHRFRATAQKQPWHPCEQQRIQLSKRQV
jgi:hypothetical protein